MTLNYQVGAERNRENKLKDENGGKTMKREDVSRIFEGATDEQINQILNLNSADIGNAKSKNDEKVSTLTQQVADLQEQVSKRDTDLTDLNSKLTAAQTDAGKLNDAQVALEALRAKYTADQEEWKAKNAKQAYDFAVKEKANSIEFTSAAAKRDFISQARAMEFKQDGDILLGFEDFLGRYKAENPGALVEPKKEEPIPEKTQPTLVLPSNGANAPQKKSLAELMRAANDNPNTIIDFSR